MNQTSIQTPAMHAESASGIDNRKLGIWLFLGSEVMFFSSLIAVYLLTRASTVKPFEVFGPSTITLITANTFLLIISSFTMVLSLAFARRGNQLAMKLSLLATVLLGATFVTIQAFEYNNLFHEGLTAIGDPFLFGSPFYLLTGFHGLHVIGGVGWNLILLIKALRGGYTKENHSSIELSGLYWHFVDVVWIILFTIIYLI